MPSSFASLHILADGCNDADIRRAGAFLQRSGCRHYNLTAAARYNESEKIIRELRRMAPNAQPLWRGWDKDVLDDGTIWERTQPVEWINYRIVPNLHWLKELDVIVVTTNEVGVHGERARQFAVWEADCVKLAAKNHGVRLAVLRLSTGNPLETERQNYDVLLKAAERTDGGGQVVSVYLQLLPIQHVRYCRTDERGIVQEVRVDTPRLVSLFGTAEREHTLVEIWRKAWDGGEGGVRFFEVEGRGYVADKELPAAVGAQTFGELGYDFVPVVWARCETPWWDATDQIDYYNELARKSEQLNVPLGVVRARATDSEGRPMPAPKVDAARLQASYHKVAGGAAALLYLPGNSEFDWSSAPIDFAALHRDMEAVWAGIVASLPEYRAATLDASTQIAAETLELLLKAAGQRVLDARGALERALVRAQQMALTLGQMAGLAGFAAADVGTYEAGDFGHVFTARDVFEPTLAAKAAALNEGVDSGGGAGDVGAGVGAVWRGGGGGI